MCEICHIFSLAEYVWGFDIRGLLPSIPASSDWALHGKPGSRGDNDHQRQENSLLQHLEDPGGQREVRRTEGWRKIKEKGNWNVIYELNFHKVTWHSEQRYQEIGRKRKDVMCHFLIWGQPMDWPWSFVGSLCLVVIVVGILLHRFLKDLEDRIFEDLVFKDICDIIHYHAQHNFPAYIDYVRNQIYQEKIYTLLMWGTAVCLLRIRIFFFSPSLFRFHKYESITAACICAFMCDYRKNNVQFATVITRLQESPQCQRLPFMSFMLLPFQRITRIKMLIEVRKLDLAVEGLLV